MRGITLFYFSLFSPRSSILGGGDSHVLNEVSVKASERAITALIGALEHRFVTVLEKIAAPAYSVSVYIGHKGHISHLAKVS